ncbi:MAG: glycosyltransferase [Anaerocolumna sp.]|jgi:abequosyltransferase|nr:glycosyltransferase [Anaerocolumna sp.]
MPIILSICIPTYNRALFLPQAIESIISQATDEVEIIICDNASTDNTAELIAAYKETFENLVYFRWGKNMGYDVNMLKAIELARGKYCWILGSDDAIKDSSISIILDEIKNDYDIYIFNRTECNIELQPMQDRCWLSNNESLEYNLNNKKEFIAYLNSATSLGAIFSYISTNVFRKEIWSAIKCEAPFVGSEYSHVYMWLSFSHQTCLLKYINKPLVMCRMGNDDLVKQGNVIKRFLLDIDGYLLMAESIFTDLDVQQAFLNVMQREHPWINILHIRRIAETEEWMDIEPKLIRYGYNQNILKAMRSKILTKMLLKYFKLEKRLNKLRKL